MDKEVGWVTGMHGGPHTRCKISLLAYTYITVVHSLTRVPLIKTIYLGFSKVFTKAAYVLWRSEAIKVSPAATTFYSPGTIDIGHSMIWRCGDRAAL